jgi:hypothetical protein
MKIISGLVLLLCISPLWLAAQSGAFENPSFEGEPADATVPVGWHAAEPGTTPDILPGFWGVHQEASHGKTYVGLITRPDGSWESITQRLPFPLQADECYRFSIDLARSRNYAGYRRPVRLLLYGGSRKGQKAQLLYRTDPIEHTYWKTYLPEFTPKEPINYLIIEAYFVDDRQPYGGNVLIDAIGAIKVCPRA